jgi:hypothetical protein
MDALSSVLAMKVNCDVVLGIMSSGLYRLLGSKIGKGYETAKSKHIFHDLVNGTVQVVVGENDLSIQMQKRAHNPFLIAAGFHQADVIIPWLAQIPLHIRLG